jgi:hypothetical protein
VMALLVAPALVPLLRGRRVRTAPAEASPA